MRRARGNIGEMLGRGCWWIGVLAASTVGCGGGDDDDDPATTSGLAGIYETVSDDYHQPCDGPPANTGNEPPYFRIVDESLLGGTYINVYACTSAEPSSCEDDTTGGPFVFLAEPTTHGAFRAESSARYGTETECTGTFYADDVKKSAAGVTITSEQRSGEWSGADCAAEFTDTLASKTKTLPCFQREVRDGRLVQ
jgi:hypothetical protein